MNCITNLPLPPFQSYKMEDLDIFLLCRHGDPLWPYLIIVLYSLFKQPFSDPRSGYLLETVQMVKPLTING